MENNSKRHELKAVDRDCSERKLTRGNKRRWKDDSNHGQPHHWRQGQENNNTADIWVAMMLEQRQVRPCRRPRGHGTCSWWGTLQWCRAAVSPQRQTSTACGAPLSYLAATASASQYTDQRTISLALLRALNKILLFKINVWSLTVILNTWQLSTPWYVSRTLSLVGRGNSVHGNMAIDICVLKTSHLNKQWILFKDEFSLIFLYLNEIQG